MGLCFSCAPSEPIRPRNVLLITIDTLRSDHCSVYGYQRETTPVLSAFAAAGARFDTSYAPTSTTGPTHASIFTSLYPVSHGVVKNGVKLSDEALTLAELLRDHGFETGGFVSSIVLEERFGYAQGFEAYDTEFSSVGATMKGGIWAEGKLTVGAFDRRAHETTHRAVDWLETGRDSSRPFFAFVHYFDPHHPYQPLGRFRTLFPPRREGATALDRDLSLYDGEIAFTDEQIGRLLEALGDAYRDTLVVITADHGEGLARHGYLHHTVHL